MAAARAGTTCGAPLRVPLLAWAMLLLALPTPAAAIDNGVGVTPPMGWRHWKAFYADISQDIMEVAYSRFVC